MDVLPWVADSCRSGPCDDLYILDRDRRDPAIRRIPPLRPCQTRRKADDRIIPGPAGGAWRALSFPVRSAPLPAAGTIRRRRPVR